ncbi:hypothetical protein [Herbaspirillum seropedicae]|uniref:hypothetical protein n=1 Tax=Herbaspirillum seropedicae TaxID=964 RepID=UPI002855EB60|nr:hypothetical protein [Herbaspirillum seropedicae]MDR6398519.1 hypothetical protein [Herbaspirillum seropedicae]
MPLTLRSVDHGDLCHGSRWTISDEDELARKVAYLALGHTRHVVKILSGLGVAKAPTIRDDAAKSASKLLTVPRGKDPWHRDGWIFQAISWIAAHRKEKGAIVRAPHAILAHKGFDGIQLRLDADGESVVAVVIFEDKATDNPRATVRDDVWDGIRKLEQGERIPELIQETGALLEAHQTSFSNLDIDDAVEAIIWESARSYRVAITVSDTDDSDDGREKLFKGFDDVAPGDRNRRQAETLSLPDLRPWMEQFAGKAIVHIETWRKSRV